MGSYRFNHYTVRYNDEVIELKPFDDTDRIVVTFNLLPEITDEPDGSVTIYGLNVKSAELSPFLDAFLDGRLNHSSVLITVFDRTKLAGMIEFIKEQPGVISAEADFDMYPD